MATDAQLQVMRAHFPSVMVHLILFTAIYSSIISPQATFSALRAKRYVFVALHFRSTMSFAIRFISLSPTQDFLCIAAALRATTLLHRYDRDTPQQSYTICCNL